MKFLKTHKYILQFAGTKYDSNELSKYGYSYVELS